MRCYTVALFVLLALVLQCRQLHAKDCNRRTTFIQVRIPQRTHVTVKYPKEINKVQYVPFPYMSSDSQCIKCQNAACQKCTANKPPVYSTVHARKTNIVIDIKGTRRLNSTADSNNTKNSSGTVDGTILGIYDKTSATSKSGATAASGDKGNSSAATASGTTLSQSDILAALNEEEVNKDNGEKSHTEDLFAVSEAGSTADANSTAESKQAEKAEKSKDESGNTGADDKKDDKSSDAGKTNTLSGDKAADSRASGDKTTEPEATPSSPSTDTTSTTDGTDGKDNNDSTSPSPGGSGSSGDTSDKDKAADHLDVASHDISTANATSIGDKATSTATSASG